MWRSCGRAVAEAVPVVAGVALRAQRPSPLHGEWRADVEGRWRTGGEGRAGATGCRPTDPRLTGLRRDLLRALGAWRRRTGFYGFPLELRAPQRLIRYQRPETTGF